MIAPNSGISRPLAAACGWIAELLWPRRCGACDALVGLLTEPAFSPAATGALCAECAAATIPLASLRTCARCAVPLADLEPEQRGLTDPRRGTDCCERCGRGYRGSPGPRITARFLYEGPLPTALVRLKWQGRLDLARPLGRLLAPELLRRAARFDAVVPVPLHPRQLRARGFNQAALLARAGLGAAGLRSRLLAPGLLVRSRDGAPSRGLGAADRERRVLGAFTAPHPPSVRGLRVLLVDDVVTTGATARACGAALLDAGAAHVEVLALLRAAS